MSDPTRLSDERLNLRDAIARALYVDAGSETSAASYADAILATPEIQRLLALRAFLTGETCATCEGLGHALTGRSTIYGVPPPCPNPDCVDGRELGVIEQLEAEMDNLGLDGLTDSTGAGFLAIIATLREGQIIAWREGEPPIHEECVP